MATVLQEDKDPNQQNPTAPSTQPSGAAGGVQPVATAGAGAPMGGGVGTAPGITGSATNAPTSSGHFTDLNKYLEANKGTDYTSNIAKNIQEQASQLQQGVQQSQQQLESQGNAEVNRLNSAVTGQNSLINQITQDPTKATTDQNAAEFQNLLNGNYNQNIGVQNQGALQNQAKDVQNAAAMTGSEAGRFQLLKNTFGNATPQYSQGQQKLDQLLMAGGAGQLQALGGQAGAIAQQSGKSLADLQNEAQHFQSTIQGLGKTAQSEAQSTLGALGTGGAAGTGLLGAEQNDLSTRLANLTTQRQSDYQNTLSALQSGKLSNVNAADLLKQGGLSNGQMLTYGVDPSAYLTQDKTNLGINNVATAEDAAKLQALSKLAGGDQSIANYATPSNTALNPAFTFNAQQFLGDVAKNQQGFNTAMQNPFPGPNLAGGPISYQAVLDNMNKLGNYEGAQGYLDQINAVRNQYGMGKLALAAQNTWGPGIPTYDVGGDKTLSVNTSPNTIGQNTVMSSAKRH